MSVDSDSNQVETAQHVQPPAGGTQFAIVELMGHLKLGGRISEVRFGGADMIRIDIPGVNDSWTTQYIGGSSVYRITFCDEITARAVPGSTVPPVADFNLLEQLQNRGFTITGPQAVLEQSEFEEAFDNE